MKFRVLIPFVICCALLSGCALQRDLVALNERMILLEERTRELEQIASASNREIRSRIERYSKTQEEKEHELRSQSAGLQATFDEFRENIQELKGKFEESDHLIKQKVGSVEEAQKTIEERLKKIEKYLTQPPQIPEPDAETGMPPMPSSGEPGPERSESETVSEGGYFEEGLPENDLYTLAKDAFDKKDFERAREGFKKLLEKYPQSRRADNAQFWLGEIYYQGKWYEKAILEYQTVIEKYPNGNKIKAALLKQGFSFFYLGDKANSRLIFQELIDRYPDSQEAELARQKLNTF